MGNNKVGIIVLGLCLLLSKECFAETDKGIINLYNILSEYNSSIIFSNNDYKLLDNYTPLTNNIDLENLNIWLDNKERDIFNSKVRDRYIEIETLSQELTQIGEDILSSKNDNASKLVNLNKLYITNYNKINSLSENIRQMSNYVSNSNNIEKGLKAIDIINTSSLLINKPTISTKEILDNKEGFQVGNLHKLKILDNSLSVINPFGIELKEEKLNTRQHHNGIDIFATRDTNIYSILNGTIINIGENNSIGNYILVESGDIKIIYGKLKSITVKEGEVVQQGVILGSINVGDLLHIGLSVNNKALDPCVLLLPDNYYALEVANDAKVFEKEFYETELETIKSRNKQIE